MALSNATTSTPASRQGAATLRLALAIGMLFLMGVTIVVGALLTISSNLDAEDARRTEFYSARALENRITSAKSYITSYAYWTTAYEHLNGEVDVNWAYTQQNVGKTLFTKDGYDGVFVLDHERTKYALIRGQPGQKDISVFAQVSASSLVDQVQNQSDVSQPVSAYTLFEGWPALITASAILREDEPVENPKTVSVLVFIDKLTPNKLRELGNARTRSRGFHWTALATVL
jgi:sensor domain CHASE-containing protein